MCTICLFTLFIFFVNSILIIGIFIVTNNHDIYLCAFHVYALLIISFIFYIYFATLHVYTLFLWMLRLKNPEQPSQLKTHLYLHQNALQYNVMHHNAMVTLHKKY